MTAHIFLSPHYDDAPGSCAGAIQRLVKAGKEVCVLTLFTGMQHPLSDFATRLHADWGLDDPMPSRAAENATACQILGCRPESLGFPDAIYRRGADGAALYDTFDAIKAEPANEDLSLPGKIADAIESHIGTNDAVIYCPLSLGNHVDHVVTRHAGEALAQRGWQVIYYTDFFYDSFAEPTRFAERDQKLLPGTLQLTRQELAQSEAVIAAYVSQIEALFGGAKGLKMYCLKHGLSERYYFLNEAARAAFLNSLPRPGGAMSETLTFLTCLADRVRTKLLA